MIAIGIWISGEEKENKSVLLFGPSNCLLFIIYSIVCPSFYDREMICYTLLRTKLFKAPSFEL
jgi:hypothetical protein